MINEVIRTSGDVRRLLAESMQAVRNGKMKLGEAEKIAVLAKGITDNMQAEVNVAKVRMQLIEKGLTTQKISHMGKLLIGDDDIPTLDGRAED